MKNDAVTSYKNCLFRLMGAFDAYNDVLLGPELSPESLKAADHDEQEILFLDLYEICRINKLHINHLLTGRKDAPESLATLSVLFYRLFGHYSPDQDNQDFTLREFFEVIRLKNLRLGYVLWGELPQREGGIDRLSVEQSVQFKAYMDDILGKIPLPSLAGQLGVPVPLIRAWHTGQEIPTLSEFLNLLEIAEEGDFIECLLRQRDLNSKLSFSDFMSVSRIFVQAFKDLGQSPPIFDEFLEVAEQAFAIIHNSEMSESTKKDFANLLVSLYIEKNNQKENK